MKRQLQIGVIGSSAKKLDMKLKKVAIDLGKEIALNNCILLFGFEGDLESVSSVAAKSCEKTGGQTIAFLWGKTRILPRNIKSMKVATGQERGGGREFSFVRSCDAIISIGGGSGTLTEIAMAYQIGVPIITIKNSGGWSQKLQGKHLDDRKKQKIHVERNAKEAVALAIKLSI